MTHQNHQTNGASLEDCHTNFFALTDLCGIKWRKFVNGERVNASSDPLDDPILRSYSRCMQADILCVWRRIQSTRQENSDPNALFEISSSKVHPPLSLAAAKELWIFWYGEEPDLTELVDAELLKVAANQALWNGTWERGLTYECRSLLFKALHNLMERFVLTKDIVRFGKWFVQPCTSNDRLFGRSSQHLSFSFTFFVHGDTVCASIDLREHPAVRPLTKEHLKEAAAALAAATNSQSHEQHGNTANLSEDVASPHNPNNGGISSNSANAPPLPKPRKVILAPFGMAATLTGNSFKATDPMAEKILEDWASFFPLCNKENSDVPPVVEVVSGGHKMYHPSIYVLVTDLDDMEEMEAAALQKDSLGTTSSAEAAALAAISSVNSNELTGDSRKLPTNHSSSVQQLQQQQQQQHAITTVTTTVATSSVQSGGGGVGGGSGSSVVFNGSGVGGNSSIAMVEQRLHELQVRTQPHYDTKASSFTANTTNTHASPQAATEMPERVWQDCITNTLHVAYAASVATHSIMGTGVPTGAATPGGSTSSTTLPSNTTTTSAGASGTTSATNSGGGGGVGIEDCNSNSGNNNGGNCDNNSGNGCTAIDTHNANTNTTNDVKDIKDINGMETKLRMQQLQFWGFVDPIEKAPCTCTKIPTLSLLPFLTNTFTSKYTASTSTTTTLSMTSPISSAPGPVSSLRLCNQSSMMMTLGCKAHTGTTGCSNTNHSHHNQQQQQYQQQYQQPHQHQYNINIPLTLLSPSSAPLTSLASSSSSTSSSSVSCSIARGVSSSYRTSMHIPFHRRQQFDFDSDSHTTGGRQNFTTNTSNSISKCQTANSSGGSGGVCYDIVIHDNGGGGTVDTVDSASPAATSNNITTMLHYKTLDTIPKQRNLNLASMTPHDTPHGGASTYSRNSVGDLMPVPSVGSPGTPAQSPHPNSTLSQPTSVPPAEQLLTTSPRAPPSVPNLQQPSTPIDHLLDKNTPAPTPTDQHDNKSITTSPYVRPTPSVEPPPSVEGGNGGGGMSNLGSNGPGSVQQPPSVGRCTPTITSQQQPQQQPAQSQAQMAGTPGPQCGTITIKKFDLQQPPLTPLNADQIQTEAGYVPATSLVGTCNRNGMPIVSVASGISAAEAISDYWKSFKTPDIKVKDIDSFANDDCSKFDVLYDFTYQNAWANHPMERFKPNEATKPYRSMCTKNLYEGHTHSKPLMPSPGSLYGSQILSIDASLNPLCDPSINGGAAMGGNTSGGLIGIAAHGGGTLTNLNDANTVGSDRNSNTSGYFHNIDIKTTDTMQGQTSPCKEGKSNASGNLYTAEGLNPSMNDLEQLFETSNDDCGSVQIHTPPDSNNPSSETTTTTTIDDLKRNSSSVTAGAVAIAALQNCNNTSNSINNPLLNNTNNSNNGSGGGGGPSMIQAEDLTKMFPTPPSHEQHHPNSSPCQMDIQMTDLSVITASASATMSTCLETTSLGGGIIKIKQEYSVELGSPVEDPIEDWSYVYRPPKRAKFVGSSKYAPLTNLPSQTLPPLVLPHNYKYKPSWTTQKSRAVVAAQAAAVQQQQLQQQQLHQQHQQLHELLSAPRTPLQQPRTPLGPIPSPMHSSTVATPLNSGGGGGGAGVSSNNLLLNQLNCPQAALTNTPGGASMQHLMQRAGMSPISPNPASVVPFPMMQQPQRHPPPPYEMAVASPATSTSSYLNKQYHSQEHPPTPQSVGMPSTHLPRPLSAAGNLMTASGGVTTGTAVARELPEVSSLIVNILLYDTALNVFRDHNFDSSTVCVCNADAQKVDIRGADSGVYVPLPGGSFNPLPSTANINGITGIGGVSSSGGGGVNMRLLSAFGGGGGGGIGNALDSPASLPGATGHTGSGSSSASATPANNNQHITGYVDDDPIDCMCGFSAVVNRRLAFRAGLFYEDEMEITGVAEDPGRNKKQSIPALIANLATALTPPASAVSPLLPNKGRNYLVPAHKIEKGGGNNVQPDAQALQCAHMIFDLLLEQCSIIQTSSSSIHRALQRHRHRLARQSRQPQSVAAIANVLEFVDANDVMCLALEQARLAFESNRMDINEFAGQHQLSPFHPAGAAGSGVARRNHHQLFSSRLTVHKWPYIPVGFSRSNKEIVRTMNFIQPMLQNAFHSKSRSAAGSKDATYTVSGPLTWRQFHRLAGRASGQCEPQPIPSVIVGHDKDWVSVAPLAIHYWDKFLLEPYAYPRDIVYLVVCPENDFVVDNTRKYFRELSSTYEMCKLGHHTPIRGWDGLLTVGPSTPTDNTTSTNTPLDDWLSTLDDSALAEKIRLYASAFHNQIAPYLNRVPGDKTLLNPPENSSCQPGAGRERGSTSPMGSSTSATHGGVGAGADADKMHNSPQKMEGVEQQQQQQQQQHQQQQQQQQSTTETADIKPDIKADNKPPIVLSDPLGMADTMEDINPPAIVLYIVEPFTFGSDSPELERLACIALLRCYAELLKSIPDSVRANMNIQIISLESIVELGRSRSRKRFSDEVRCLALNIFSQCRRHLLHTQAVKSLTGFGTAANMEAFLKSKDDKNRQPYKMYTPPYVLAPMHEKNDKSDFSRQSASMRALNEQKYSVMYCNYCLSEDQSWLLATVTDDRGEMFEKIIINIDVPNRTRRRKAPARRVGLKKLMDFIMGLISQTTHPWRLVVGRIGRIGHSELKSWSSLLSKQNLQKASKQLKDCCKQCSLMYPPGILSACLVTLEPDSKLRVMPDQFTPDERFSQISMQNPLSTPQDVTCTHILVFPTSAVCLSFTRQFQNEPQVDLENDFLNFDEEDENEGFTDADLGDLLLWDPQPGRMSNHCSPEPDENRSWQSASGNNFNSAQQQDVEEVGSINQQPLAVGYMVSTAPTGRMPSWFWSACPHLEDVCPVFLKTALHLHVPNIQTTDDILNSTNAHSSATDHPLDSSLTADVLRFVLEGYNALSWLALDSNTHDRLSCLPINVQMLMDLYYLAAAIM